MPTAYGAEFRQDVIDVARKGGAPLAQVAKDFGLSVTTLNIEVLPPATAMAKFTTENQPLTAAA